MVPSPNDTAFTESKVFVGLANEADRLAKMLCLLQNDFSLIPDEAFPDAMRTSGQAVDSAEQGLRDFALIFSALSKTEGPLSAKSLEFAMSHARQHRVRKIHAEMISNQTGPAPDEEIELF